MRYNELFERRFRLTNKDFSKTDDVTIGFEFEYVASGDVFKLHDKSNQDISKLHTLQQINNLIDGDNDTLVKLETNYKKWKYITKKNSEKLYIKEEGIESIIKSIIPTPHGFDFQNMIYYPWVEYKLDKQFLIISNVLSSEINEKITVFTDYHQTDKDFSEWYMEPDASVHPEDYDDVAVEIVTPIFNNVNEASQQLKKVFNFINKTGYTNKSTGLHINIGFKDNKEFNPIKLLLLLGEKHVARLFGREDSKYAESLLDLLLRNLTVGHEYTKEALQDLDEFEKYLEEVLNEADKPSFNISKGNYVEFRIIGNQNYEKRYNEISNIIKRYAYVLTAAADPVLGREAYLKKLAKLVTNALDTHKQQQKEFWGV